MHRLCGCWGLRASQMSGAAESTPATSCGCAEEAEAAEAAEEAALRAACRCCASACPGGQGSDALHILQAHPWQPAHSSDCCLPRRLAVCKGCRFDPVNHPLSSAAHSLRCRARAAAHAAGTQLVRPSLAGSCVADVCLVSAPTARQSPFIWAPGSSAASWRHDEAPGSVQHEPSAAVRACQRGA